MPDLALDTPNALALTDAFRARAVTDKVLSEEEEEEAVTTEA
jgi:hypothetical protein